MSTKIIGRIDQVAYHRNGISGAPFYAVLFTGSSTDLPKPERFLASVFEEPGAVSVISLSRIEESGVTFGENSYRGDAYEPELRAAIAAYEAA